MENMESYRKLCLARQSELRHMLSDPIQQQEGMQFFLSHHAMLHSAGMAGTEPWSFEDEVFNAASEAQVRCIPSKAEHSIAWNIWHIARIEDITMNLLVAGSPQVLHQKNWLEQMKVTVQDTGNAMDRDEIADLSARIDVGALREYRLVVGRRTRQIITQLQPGTLKQKVDPSRLRRAYEEGAVVAAAQDVLDYWGRRDIVGLLLMPASRHLIVHLNESLTIKKMCQ